MSNVGQEKIWRLLAIGIEPEVGEAQLYGLVLEGAEDWVLTRNGRILLFRDPARARSLIESDGAQWACDEIDVDQPFFWCDLGRAMQLLRAGGVDEQACVLDAVNALLDLVLATGIEMPAAHRAALRSIADYCTFEKDLAKYFDEAGDFPAEAIIEAVIWSVGAVVLKSTVV